MLQNASNPAKTKKKNMFGKICLFVEFSGHPKLTPTFSQILYSQSSRIFKKSVYIYTYVYLYVPSIDKLKRFMEGVSQPSCYLFVENMEQWGILKESA